MESGEPTGTEAPIADLHCHYPMHLLARDPEVQSQLPKRRGREVPENLTLEYVIRVRRHPGIVAKLRAFLVLIAARLRNFRSYEDSWRVDLPKLRRGGVGVVCSVLYLPFAEIGDERDGDYDELLQRLGEVEDELAREPQESRPLVVKSESDLDRALAERRIAILHSIEGGFHLGRDKELIDERVRRARAARGGLHHARPSDLPRCRHQRAGAADVHRPRVRGDLLPAEGRRPEPAGRARRPGDVRAPDPGRHQPHARRRDRGDVRAARPPGSRARRGRQRLPGRRNPRRVPVRRAELHARPRDDPQGRRPRRHGRPDHGPAPAQRRPRRR